MSQPVELSDDLMRDAGLASKASGLTIAGQIEHWARIGRAVDAMLRTNEVSVLKRRPLSCALTVAETAEGNSSSRRTSTRGPIHTSRQRPSIQDSW
jgi:hypothetical protein